jgi:tetratricopeptide (TPR) repeat protein
LTLGLLDLKRDDLGAARSRLAEMRSSLPSYSSLLHAEILLAERSAEKAIAVCEKAPLRQIPYMSDTGGMLTYNLPLIKDVLARAYLLKGDVERAILEYEGHVAFQPASGDRRLVHPMLHYRLAKLYQEQGRLDLAGAQYERVLSIWKNAQVPEVADARERLEALKTKS